MVRAIRDYYDRTGFKVGYKPAGGIRKAKPMMAMMPAMITAAITAMVSIEVPPSCI